MKTILVPTDFSPFAAEAMRRAVHLGGLLNANIHVVHVIDDSALYYSSSMDGMPIPITDDVTQSLDTIAKNRMQEWLQPWQELGITSHAIHSRGALASTICDLGEEIGAQLIVIGKHGHQSLIEHLLIGSTTEQVVRHAHCSVFVAMPKGILGQMEES